MAMDHRRMNLSLATGPEHFHQLVVKPADMGDRADDTCGSTIAALNDLLWPCTPAPRRASQHMLRH
jgi:hypothetical protein